MPIECGVPRSSGKGLTTICGVCEREWDTDTGRQVCPECGNDGEVEAHVIRDDNATDEDDNKD